ncbi:MAG: sterol desaturase family protein [Deltaproteobacteria bacterium]|nr:sterol desaturase family protein [Deltaproteobacteria bacterium]
MEVAGPDVVPGELAARLLAPLADWLGDWSALLHGALLPVGCALVAVAVCTSIELLVPAERGQGLAGRIRNLAHLVVFQFAGLAGLALWLRLGPALGRHAHAPGPVESIVLVAVNLFTIDFVYYWYHRAQHRFPSLWAIHELHHADTELNATSSFRTFWLELPLQSIVVMSPSLVLFGDQGAGHAFGMLIGSYAFLIFSHCNFRLSLGPLSGLVCGPQVHRIHHSRLPQHRDRNFAQYFPFLDRLFGTWYAPAPGEFPPTGADALASDASLATVFVRPFRIWLSGAGAVAPPARSSGAARRRPSRRS